MKKLWILLVFASMAVLCPAPINQQPPSDYKELPFSKSEETLAKEQAQQSVQKEVGRVETKTENVTSDPQNGSSDAQDALRAASAKKGEDVVERASKSIEKSGSRGTSIWVWIIVILAGSFGIVFLAKSWADRHIPDPNDARKKKETW